MRLSTELNDSLAIAQLAIFSQSRNRVVSFTCTGTAGKYQNAECQKMITVDNLSYKF